MDAVEEGLDRFASFYARSRTRGVGTEEVGIGVSGFRIMIETKCPDSEWQITLTGRGRKREKWDE